MCRLKQARIVPCGSGKRALGVTKQLGFEQRFRNRCTVHRDERMLTTPAGCVNGPRQEFLPRPTCALNKHTRVTLGHQLCLEQQIFHQRAVRHELASPQVIAVHRGCCNPTHPQSAFDVCQQIFAVKRLGEEAKHPTLRRRDGIGDGAVCGKNNDG